MKKVLQGREKKKKDEQRKEEEARRARIEEGKQQRAQMGEARRKEEAQRKEAEHHATGKQRQSDRLCLQEEEAAWSRLGNLHQPAVLNLADLPKLSTAAIRARMEDTTNTKKQVFKELYRRWHPDKFMPKYAAFIAEDEREAIQEAVTKTFRCLKRYSDKLEEA